MKNLKQTHLFFQVLTSHRTFEQLQTASLDTDWVNYRNNYVYVMLNKGTDQDQLSSALQQVSATATEYHPEKEVVLESIGLTDAVPRWNISNAIGIGWDHPSMIFFLSVGLLVLLPAVFNYTNLSIARALKRGKEIGVRKVVGAEKGQIKAQFIIETILLSLLALTGSVLIYIPIKREFLSMVVAAEVLDTSMGFIQITVFVLFAVAIGVLAGIFPAQYFAKLNPIHTMKGNMKNGSNSVSGFKRVSLSSSFFFHSSSL